MEELSKALVFSPIVIVRIDGVDRVVMKVKSVDVLVLRVEIYKMVYVLKY